MMQVHQKATSGWFVDNCIIKSRRLVFLSAFLAYSMAIGQFECCTNKLMGCISADGKLCCYTSVSYTLA
jgi:hypothetical protein